MDSRTFTVPLSNVQLNTSTSLQRGDIVSFSFEKLSRTSLPVDPKIYKVRKDVSWSDVLHSSKPLSQVPNSMTLALSDFSNLSLCLQLFHKWLNTMLGFSSKLTKLPTQLERYAKNLRTTLEKIAYSQGLDPLNPHTWYNNSPKEIIKRTQVSPLFLSK